MTQHLQTERKLTKTNLKKLTCDDKILIKQCNEHGFCNQTLRDSIDMISSIRSQSLRYKTNRKDILDAAPQNSKIYNLTQTAKNNVEDMLEADGYLNYQTKFKQRSNEKNKLARDNSQALEHMEHFNQVSQFRLNLSQGNKTNDDPDYLGMNLLHKKKDQREKSDFSVCEELENIMQISE
jgi:hypothetical protein